MKSPVRKKVIALAASGMSQKRAKSAFSCGINDLLIMKNFMPAARIPQTGFFH
jgi:hypothetical protein